MRRFGITLTFILFLVDCSSTGSREGGLSPAKMGKDTIQKLQSIDSELGQRDISVEKRNQLKLEKAKILVDHGNYDEATVLLQEVLKAKNDAVNNSEVNLYLGKAYYAKSDYGKAIVHLRSSERLDRTNDYDHERKKMVAKSLYEEKEYYPALAALSKAYKGNDTPKDIFYYETAAQTYFKMGYTNKSLDFYKRSLQIAELGLKEFPESLLLERVRKDCLEALGPNR
jgi:tetratricopeptide (TPR) repeat protein